MPKLSRQFRRMGNIDKKPAGSILLWNLITFIVCLQTHERLQGPSWLVPVYVVQYWAESINRGCIFRAHIPFWKAIDQSCSLVLAFVWMKAASNRLPFPACCALTSLGFVLSYWQDQTANKAVYSWRVNCWHFHKIVSMLVL